MTFDEFLVSVRDDNKPVEQLMQDAWDAAVAECVARGRKVADGYDSMSKHAADAGDALVACLKAEGARLVLYAVREVK